MKKISRERDNNGFIKGAFSLTLAALLVKIIGVIYKIPLSYILGDEGMGFFNSAYSVYTFFFLLCSAGVPKAVTILTTEAKTNKNTSEELSILSDTLKFFFVLGLSVTLIFILTAGYLSSFIGNRRAVASMLAIAPAIAFISVSSVYRGYLNGHLAFGRVAISQCIEAFFKLALGLILAGIAVRMHLPSEIISAYAIFGITLGSAFTCLYLMIETKRQKEKYNLRQKNKFSFSRIKRIWKISLPITASSALMSFVNVLDLMLIMRRLGYLGYTEQISGILYGNYTTLAIPMFNFVLSIITSITTSVLPILTEQHTKGNTNEFNSALKSAAELSFFVAVPATFFYAFFSKETLTILFEKSSVAVGEALLALLAPAVILITFLTVLNTALEASGKYNVPLVSMFIGCFVKLLSTYILVGNDKFAIWGAPLGTVASYLASILISLLFIIRNKKALGTVIKSVIGSVCVSFISLVLLQIMKQHLFELEEGVITSLITLTVFGIIYLAFSLIFGTLSLKKLKNLSF